jgi:hypothetical protein
MSEPKDADPIRSQQAYRWTCPICQETNRGFATEKDPRDAAMSALRSHVRIHDGDDHGSEHELPDGLDLEAFVQYGEIDVGTD